MADAVDIAMVRMLREMRRAPRAASGPALAALRLPDEPASPPPSISGLPEIDRACGEGFGDRRSRVGVVQEAPLPIARHHPHLHPLPAKRRRGASFDEDSAGLSGPLSDEARIAALTERLSDLRREFERMLEPASDLDALHEAMAELGRVLDGA